MPDITQNNRNVFLQTSLGGALIEAVPPLQAANWPFGAELYDATQGFTYRVQTAETGTSNAHVWRLSNSNSNLTASFASAAPLVLTAATIKGVNTVVLSGAGEVTLPLASLVPTGARFTIVQGDGTNDITVQANAANTALAPAVVLEDTGESITLQSTGAATGVGWIQIGRSETIT